VAEDEEDVGAEVDGGTPAAAGEAAASAAASAEPAAGGVAVNGDVKMEDAPAPEVSWPSLGRSLCARANQEHEAVTL